MATLIIKGGASPALVWTVDDGASSGPKRGNGGNGGTVQQIQLHEGVNTGISSTALEVIRNSTLPKTLRASGGDLQVRAF